MKVILGSLLLSIPISLTFNISGCSHQPSYGSGGGSQTGRDDYLRAHIADLERKIKDQEGKIENQQREITDLKRTLEELKEQLKDERSKREAIEAKVETIRTWLIVVIVVGGLILGGFVAFVFHHVRTVSRMTRSVRLLLARNKKLSHDLSSSDQEIEKLKRENAALRRHVAKRAVGSADRSHSASRTLAPRSRNGASGCNRRASG